MYFFTFILTVFSIISIKAQDWKILQQKAIGLEYKIPANWFVGGIIQEKESPQTISTLNVAPHYAVSMYIKSSSQIDLEKLQTQKINNYTLASTQQKANQIESTDLVFQSLVSFWEQDKKSLVLQLSTQTPDGKNYVIYFWGTPADIAKNKKLIETILYSIKKTTI